MAVWVCVKESLREREQEHVWPSVWKYGENEKGQRGSGEEGAGRLIKELMKLRRMTLTHVHTTQHDMTLITAEIDLTLLKTGLGWGKNETQTEWKHRSRNYRKHDVSHYFVKNIYGKKPAPEGCPELLLLHLGRKPKTTVIWNNSESLKNNIPMPQIKRV